MRNKIISFILLLYTIVQALGQTPNSQTTDRFKGPWSSPYHNFPVDNEYLESLNLNDYSDNDILPSTVLSFSRSSEGRTIWGRGKEIDAVFDNEYLSVFFERELVLDTFDIGTGLVKWVFTGNEGGWTVQISKDSVHLYQRYYNSFGLSEVIDGNSARNFRHPNKIWLVSAIAITGKLRTVKLSTDCNYNVKLELNGKEVASQTTRIDVFRNQLQFQEGITKISGKLYKPEAEKVEIKINSDITHQEIIGFGGIASIPAYQELSIKGKEMWWKLIEEYNLLIQREYPVGQMLDENYSNWDDMTIASPHYYGDNYPNGEISDFEYNKKIIDMGGGVVFSFWRLPELLLNADGTVNGKAYSDAIISYCKALKLKSGAFPMYVGIQNEVVKDAAQWHTMTKALRLALDKNGMSNVKIMMFNAPFVSKAIPAVKAFKEDKEVWDMIDYAGSNMYDFNALFKTPWKYDSLLLELKEEIGNKPFVSPELSVNWNDYLAQSYRVAFSMAMLYHKNMTILDAVSLQYCWTILNSAQEGFDITRSLTSIDEKNGFVPYEQGFQLRVFGAYSRHLPKGAVRVGATSSDDKILVTAYETPKGKVAIILNQGIKPASISIDAVFDEMERVSWCSNAEKLDFVKSFNVEPGEIVTLYDK